MLRERFLCCDNSRTRELLWHCENSERGEFCEFELTQHASLISWHKKAITMWQLNATRPSSQSSKKRDTPSLDQFAQRLQERGYRRCARNLQKTCPHFLPTHRHRCSKQGFLGSHTSTCLSALEKSHRPTEGHSPQPSCGDRSRHMLSLFRLGCRARVQPTH